MAPLLATLVCSAVSAAPPVPARQPARPDVAKVLASARAADRWIARADSFLLEANGTWTRSEKAIALARRQLRQQFPEADVSGHPELLPTLQERLQVAFDRRRLRYSQDQGDVY